MINLLVFRFFIIVAIFFNIGAYSYQPLPKAKSKTWKIQTEIGHFSTTANYDTEGSTFTALPNNQKYEKTNVQVNSYYGLNKRWTFLSGLSLGYGKSIGASTTRKNSQLTDIQIGTSFLWDTKPLLIVPHFNFNYPIATFDNSTDDLILNEGSLDLAPAIWIGKKIFTVQTYIEPGFLIRSGSRSHLFTLKSGAYKNLNLFILGAELHAEKAITDDETFNTPSIKQAVTDKVNAGSTRYYSTNPELYSVRIWANYNWHKKFGYQIGYDQSINGKNTANGYTIFAAVNWNLNHSVISKKIKSPQFIPEQEEADEKTEEYFKYNPEVPHLEDQNKR